jgi:ribosomal protein L20
MSSVVAILSRYEENTKWVSKHYEELKKKFRNEWIAVLNGAVVDHDRQLNKLVEKLRRRYPKNYSEIAVEYVTIKEIELIL